MAEIRADIALRATLGARARGMIFKEFPRAVLVLAGANTAGQLQALANGTNTKARQARAALEFKAFTQQVVSPNENLRICRTHDTGLDENFVRVALGMNGDSMRSDSKTVFAFELVKVNDRMKFLLRGVASYGASDALDTENNTIEIPDDATLQNNIHNGRLVEIDLMCVKPTQGRPAAGHYLLAHIMAKACKQKKAGKYKYRGAMLRLAGDPGTQGRAMNRLAERYGFEQVQTNLISDDGSAEESNRFLYAAGSNWLTNIRDALEAPPKVCNMQGTTKCQ